LLGVSTSGTIFQLPSTSDNKSGSYIGSFIRMTDPAPGESGLFVAHGGVGTNTFQLAATASTVNNYYRGMTLIDNDTGDFRTIVTYNGGARTGTVSQNWTAGTAGDEYFLVHGVDTYGEEKKIVQYISENGVFVAFGGIGTSTFTLPLS